jgi:hypothetical protein
MDGGAGAGAPPHRHNTGGFHDAELYENSRPRSYMSAPPGAWHAGLKGPMYRFNPEESPKAVFERFFGTANPYEALEALSNQFESMTSEEAPARGKNKVVSERDVAWQGEDGRRVST